MTLQVNKREAIKEIGRMSKELSEKEGITYTEAARRLYDEGSKLAEVAAGIEPSNRDKAFKRAEAELTEKANETAKELKLPFNDAFRLVLVRPENGNLARTYVSQGRE